jgi:hypothetical protein
LKVFDKLDWMGSDAGMEQLSNGMDRYKVHAVISQVMAANLSLVDERSLRAGMIGTNPAGLFKVK